MEKRLDNLPVAYQVQTKVIYELTDFIDTPLCIIFNSSFSSGFEPEGWKIGQDDIEKK